MFLRFKSSPYWLIAALFLSGCLPSSCTRIESKEISAADSLSRALAASFPVDTLTVIDRIQPDSDLLVYPRTIGYDEQGVLWITDTAQHVVLSLGSDTDTLVPRDTIPDSYPYLAGFRAGSVFAFSPAFHKVYELQQGRVTREIALQGDLPEKGGLRYAIATDSGFAVKIAANGFQSYIARLSDQGAVDGRINLESEEWRYAGLLRASGDTLFSLAGYLPQIDRWVGGELDSLSLIGFDSPMLARTRQFRSGETDQPPLLTASAIKAGGHWFVLNMRPGWTQIDVYSFGGSLQYILTEPNPAFNQEFFPTDIAVFALSDGGYHIAVSMVKPEPRIDRYYWHP